MIPVIIGALIVMLWQSTKRIAASINHRLQTMMKNPSLFRVSAWIVSSDRHQISRLVQVEVLADDFIQAHDFAMLKIDLAVPNIISYGEISITENHRMSLLSTNGVDHASDLSARPSCSKG